MPTKTGLQPKINHASSKQHQMHSSCTGCGMTSPTHLIEIFIVTGDNDSIPPVTREVLCGSCLVGNDVAILRPTCNDWCFGEVVDYDSSLLHPFLMLFTDGKKEWACISPTPSRDYLVNIGVGLSETTSLATSTVDQCSVLPTSSVNVDVLPTSTMDQCSLLRASTMDQSIGTFYSSSMSSMGSFDHSHVFPLFDDENLVHVDSFSSLDDDGFADDKGPPSKRVSKGSRARVRPKAPRIRASGVSWTPEEDRNLIAVVEEFNKSGRNYNWTDVANKCPNRMNKQCRERYVNQLSSTLHGCEWRPWEDAILFTAFFRTGTSWSKLARLLPGRTDNKIKNRFHHIKRRINKDFRCKVQRYMSLIPRPDDEPPVVGDSVEAIMRKTHKLLKVYSGESKRRATSPYMKGYVFGPFVNVIHEAKMCPRCGLFIPSAQTGHAICSKTKWCEACTMIPPFVAHDMLRECLDMRRDDDSMVGMSQN